MPLYLKKEGENDIPVKISALHIVFDGILQDTTELEIMRGLEARINLLWHVILIKKI